MNGKHARHVCWSCGGSILPEQEEEPVLGLKPTEIRYRHAGEEDCHESLSHAGTRRIILPPVDPISYLDDQREEDGRYHQ